jgi:hypothetical protein
VPELQRLRTDHGPAVLAFELAQKVLIRAGFIPVGPADPASLGGKQGTWQGQTVRGQLSAAASLVKMARTSPMAGRWSTGSGSGRCVWTW